MAQSGGVEAFAAALQDAFDSGRGQQDPEDLFLAYFGRQLLPEAPRPLRTAFLDSLSFWNNGGEDLVLRLISADGARVQDLPELRRVSQVIKPKAFFVSLHATAAGRAPDALVPESGLVAFGRRYRLRGFLFRPGNAQHYAAYVRVAGGWATFNDAFRTLSGAYAPPRYARLCLFESSEGALEDCVAGVGFANRGNQCYALALVQLLRHSAALARAVHVDAKAPLAPLTGGELRSMLGRPLSAGPAEPRRRPEPAAAPQSAPPEQTADEIAQPNPATWSWVAAPLLAQLQKPWTLARVTAALCYGGGPADADPGRSLFYSDEDVRIALVVRGSDTSQDYRAVRAAAESLFLGRNEPASPSPLTNPFSLDAWRAAVPEQTVERVRVAYGMPDGVPGWAVFSALKNNVLYRRTQTNAWQRCNLRDGTTESVERLPENVEVAVAVRQRAASRAEKLRNALLPACETLAAAHLDGVLVAYGEAPRQLALLDTRDASEQSGRRIELLGDGAPQGAYAVLPITGGDTYKCVTDTEVQASLLRRVLRPDDLANPPLAAALVLAEGGGLDKQLTDRQNNVNWRRAAPPFAFTGAIPPAEWGADSANTVFFHARVIEKSEKHWELECVPFFDNVETLTCLRGHLMASANALSRRQPDDPDARRMAAEHWIGLPLLNNGMKGVVSGCFIRDDDLLHVCTWDTSNASQVVGDKVLEWVRAAMPGPARPPARRWLDPLRDALRVEADGVVVFSKLPVNAARCAGSEWFASLAGVASRLASSAQVSGLAVARELAALNAAGRARFAAGRVPASSARREMPRPVRPPKLKTVRMAAGEVPLFQQGLDAWAPQLHALHEARAAPFGAQPPLWPPRPAPTKADVLERLAWGHALVPEAAGLNVMKAFAERARADAAARDEEDEADAEAPVDADPETLPFDGVFSAWLTVGLNAVVYGPTLGGAGLMQVFGLYTAADGAATWTPALFDGLSSVDAKLGALRLAAVDGAWREPGAVAARVRARQQDADELRKNGDARSILGALQSGGEMRYTDFLSYMSKTGLANGAQLGATYSFLGVLVHGRLAFRVIAGRSEAGASLFAQLVADKSYRAATGPADLYVPFSRAGPATPTAPVTYEAGGTYNVQAAFAAMFSDAVGNDPLGLIVTQYVDNVFDNATLRAGDVLGKLDVVAVEYPVYNPYCAHYVPKRKGFRALETRIDFLGFGTVERLLVLGEYKTLMELNPPRERIAAREHIIQVVVNAFLLFLCTGLRADKGLLVYSTRRYADERTGDGAGRANFRSYAVTVDLGTTRERRAAFSAAFRRLVDKVAFAPFLPRASGLVRSDPQTVYADTTHAGFVWTKPQDPPRGAPYVAWTPWGGASELERAIEAFFSGGVLQSPPPPLQTRDVGAKVGREAYAAVNSDGTFFRRLAVPGAARPLPAPAAPAARPASAPLVEQDGALRPDLEASVGQHAAPALVPANPAARPARGVRPEARAAVFFMPGSRARRSGARRDASAAGRLALCRAVAALAEQLVDDYGLAAGTNAAGRLKERLEAMSELAAFRTLPARRKPTFPVAGPARSASLAALLTRAAHRLVNAVVRAAYRPPVHEPTFKAGFLHNSQRLYWRPEVLDAARERVLPAVEARLRAFLEMN